MSFQLAKVLGNNYLRQTIKVAVPRLKFDEYLLQHFRENEELLAHDPQEQCKAGDWVLIRELQEPLSLQVKHKLEKIVYNSGNIIDPLTGKKCVGYEYEEDLEQYAKTFGKKPLLERLREMNATKNEAK
ncbi:28S ribosomal protein S17, mitochondrial [Halotydeus destructor]|nr:28S ribosomal protein S17, mitochondrial [Halotydeus destructor]